MKLAGYLYMSIWRKNNFTQVCKTLGRYRFENNVVGLLNNIKLLKNNN